jgi:hypothetical protein
MSVRSASSRTTPWNHWATRSAPFAAVTAVLALAVMSTAETQAMLVVVLTTGVFVTLLLMTGDEPLPLRPVLTAAIWVFGVGGLFVWTPWVGFLVGAAVLCSTPVRRAVLEERIETGHSSGPIETLADRDLLRQWARSSCALALSADRPEHALRIVTRRAAMLEEIDRRGLMDRCRL